jgi:hypothetical protein
MLPWKPMRLRKTITIKPKAGQAEVTKLSMLPVRQAEFGTGPWISWETNDCCEADAEIAPINLSAVYRSFNSLR